MCAIFLPSCNHVMMTLYKISPVITTECLCCGQMALLCEQNLARIKSGKSFIHWCKVSPPFPHRSLSCPPTLWSKVNTCEPYKAVKQGPCANLQPQSHKIHCIKHLQYHPTCTVYSCAPLFISKALECWEIFLSLAKCCHHYTLNKTMTVCETITDFLIYLLLCGWKRVSGCCETTGSFFSARSNSFSPSMELLCFSSFIKVIHWSFLN